MERKALLELWNTTLNSKDRDPIVKAMQKRGLFPEEYMRQWDKSTGAYPDYNDPEFLQRLLAKKEFAESFQSTWDPENDPCAADTKFEITPVQRFAANLMSPRTPYMSALLYHGVGVGKTCSAIQISEAWLEEFPQEQVIIIAPPTIQEGFRTTIFDATSRRFTLGTGTEPNKAFGCTGDTYLELTGTVLERDLNRIELRIKRAINRRYQFFGYIQFHNYVKGLLNRFAKIEDKDKREEEERQELRKVFSNKLLIIDEAHNLREVDARTAENDDSDEPGGRDAGDDMKAGKLMTPSLLKVLDYSYGMKLVLMTATPMYNSHLEIIFLVNLLLRNDKKALITQDMVFDKNGDLIEGADKLLGSIASRYISFMRGENPRSFPLRLKPTLAPDNRIDIKSYPTLTMRDRVISKEEKIYVNHLPIVRIPLPPESENYKASVEFLTEQTTNTNLDKERGISSQELGLSVQAGNFVPPMTGTEDYKKRIRDGLAGVFIKESKPRIIFKPKPGSDAKWLLKENLINYSPKFVYLLDHLATCEGVAFVYSRFIDSGALPLAVALEANGYKCFGRETGFLMGGAQDGRGGQCAFCNRREVGHDDITPAGIDPHEFKQAYYGLLTGEKAYTPDRNLIIKGEQAITNKNGAELKVVIGSQIASEGVDLRYVREVHVLDSWYHLNKTEQVIGRAIRFCSHSALETKKRNTTIYLYAAYYSDLENETADLYSYRLAFRKAKQVGLVSRALKAYAIDCNLNHDAIIIRNQDPVYQIDSQRISRPKVNINDVGFTAICDWVENCDYTCKPQIDPKAMGTDDSTYSEYAVRWRETELRETMRRIFAKSAFVELADMEAMFPDVPAIARADFLTGIIDNKLFQVMHKDVKGYIKFCNNYFVFQPFIYADINIPLAIRMASFPVRKDFFDPAILELQDISLVEEETPIETSELTTLWSAFEAWATTLSTSKTWTDETKPIVERLVFLAKGDRKQTSYFNMILLMMRQFHMSVNANAMNAEAFRNTILEYVWDNWFSLAEQKRLAIPDMLKDAAYASGARMVSRFYNPDTDSLEYEEKGASIAPTTLAVVRKQEDEDERDFREREEGNRFSTGSPYGFLIGKRGTLVFKTNQVAPLGTKMYKGKECGNDTLSDPKYLILEALGDRLRSKGAPDLELTTANIRGKLSAAQSCILMELVMRYMDNTKFDKKRWFYRPVMARILGHLGEPLEKREASKSKKAKPIQVVKVETPTTAPVTTTTVAPTTAAKTTTKTIPVRRFPVANPKNEVVVTKVDE